MPDLFQKTTLGADPAISLLVLFVIPRFLFLFAIEISTPKSGDFFDYYGKNIH